MSVTLPFTEAVVAEIAALLGVAARAKPYRERDAAGEVMKDTDRCGRG
jgi:hypothetical protein